ncbi:MAG: hypothetical protein AB7N65_01745 [Vicinamibacterales bacterium]
MVTGKRLLPALLLAFATTVTPACASSAGWYRYPQGRVGVDHRAYDVGYREGFEHGRDDARRERPFDYSRHGDYRDADDGYRGGNRQAYRQVFRDGFENGYRDAYRQFARRGSDRDGWNRPPRGAASPPLRDHRRFGSVAAEQGYRDGYAQGRDDGRDGDRYDPVRAKRYREGDHEYDKRYGSRDNYKREYRAAFERGYEQGYREVRRR